MTSGALDLPKSPIGHAPQTGDALVTEFRAHFPHETADVPAYCWRVLAHVTDEALTDARSRGNVPRQLIAEDGQQAGRTQRTQTLRADRDRDRERRDAKRARGECVACPQPARVGATMCGACQAVQRKRMADVRAGRIA